MGSIAIPEMDIKNNRMNWNVFDFFKAKLKEFTSPIYAGWYAYKLIDKVYYFKWKDQKEKLSSAYVNALIDDKWIVANSIKTNNNICQQN